MTLTDMIGYFRIYTQDTEKNDFSIDFIIQMLNNNQKRVLSILPRHIFPELDTSVLAQSLTSGAFDLSGLTVSIYNKAQGLTGVKTSGGYFCKRISFDEYRIMIDKETQGTFTFETTKPIYYVQGTNIYIKPIPTTIDLFYMKEPRDMEWDVETGYILENVVYYVVNYTKVTYDTVDYAARKEFTGVAVTTYTTTAPPSGAGVGRVMVNCEFSDDIAIIILGLSLEIYVDKFPEARRIYENAITMIRSLGKYSDSESAKFAVMRGSLGVPGVGAGKFNIYNFQ